MNKTQARAELLVCHNKLDKLDYKLLKKLDGEITATEYAPFKDERARLRARIRELREIIKE